eukprot:gb/GFBE01045679.1/.p1 GENE.gb/GFBE01045679.1/~~gb/GFBE01045679.1/.p1  ORF type:complete len:265 (+),score=33.79 gb/GFBE01045679.1/:1-795(+)
MNRSQDLQPGGCRGQRLWQELPDDGHEYAKVSKPLKPAGQSVQPSAAEETSRWSAALLPLAARFGLSCSDGCASHTDELEPGDTPSPHGTLSGLIVPLPAVALEGPADLPKSSAVAMSPLAGPARSAVASKPALPTTGVPAKAAPTERQRDSATQVSDSRAPASARVQPATSGHRTLKFYPQPSDDRSGKAVDVIEHGYEVLIVRREPSPTPRCPAAVLQPWLDGSREGGGKHAEKGRSVQAGSWMPSSQSKMHAASSMGDFSI